MSFFRGKVSEEKKRFSFAWGPGPTWDPVVRTRPLFDNFLVKIQNSRNWLEKKDLDFLSTGFDTEFSGGSF